MSPHILLVEDELLIRMVLGEALEEAGFEVSQAEDADVAAAVIGQSDAVDLLVTDIQMPGACDGVALGRLIRARFPGMPIIYTTGRPDALRALARLGPQEIFIAKPYAPSEIVAAARRMIGGAYARRGAVSQAAGYKRMCG